MKKISKDAKFLKGSSKIKVGTICKKHKLDVANIQTGRSTHENEIMIFNEVIKELLLLFIDVYLTPEIKVIEDERYPL